MNGYLIVIRGGDDHIPLGMWRTLPEAVEWLTRATPEELIERYEAGVSCSPGDPPCETWGVGCMHFADGRPRGRASLPELVYRRVEDIIARHVGCEDLVPLPVVRDHGT